MAGRYVILQFEDRDAAESFVANEYMPDQLGYVPVAMYLKPKAFCDCPPKKTRGITKTGRLHNDNWRKNRKYGLYICVECGRPSRHHEGGIIQRLQYVFGFNLLNPVD